MKAKFLFGFMSMQVKEMVKALYGNKLRYGFHKGNTSYRYSLNYSIYGT